MLFLFDGTCVVGSSPAILPACRM